MTIKAPTKKIQCFRGVLTGFFPVNQEDKVILRIVHSHASRSCWPSANEVHKTQGNSLQTEAYLKARPYWGLGLQSRLCSGAHSARLGGWGLWDRKAYLRLSQILCWGLGEGVSRPCAPGRNSPWCHVHVSITESQTGSVNGGLGDLAAKKSEAELQSLKQIHSYWIMTGNRKKKDTHFLVFFFLLVREILVLRWNFSGFDNLGLDWGPPLSKEWQLWGGFWCLEVYSGDLGCYGCGSWGSNTLIRHHLILSFLSDWFKVHTIHVTPLERKLGSVLGGKSTVECPQLTWGATGQTRFSQAILLFHYYLLFSLVIVWGGCKQTTKGMKVCWRWFALGVGVLTEREGCGDEEEVKQRGLVCRRDGSACTNHGASTQ